METLSLSTAGLLPGQNRSGWVVPARTARHRFGEILEEKGWVTPDQLQEGLRDQEQAWEFGWWEPLGEILLRQGTLTLDQFLEALETQVQDSDEAERGREDLRSGDRIGKYILGKYIGKGGMGSVYAADDEVLRRRVALKVVPDLFSTEDKIDCLRREAAVLARFRRPDIVAIHEFGFGRASSGKVYGYIAMDFIPGRTFEEEVTKNSGRTLREKVSLLEDAARTVAFVHSQGVLHLDLKPANLLFDSDGRVVLADFGLARVLEEGVTSLPSEGSYGTPVYMAPEQVAGEAVDARTDVYALGVILYQILTGRLPFDRETPSLLYWDIMMAEPPRPSAIRSDIDPAAEALCLRALRKMKEARPASAAEFAAGLAGLR